MAVVTRKSALITARDGGTLIGGRQQGGVLRSSRASVLSVVADSVASIYRIIPVRSADALAELKIWSEAQGAGVTGNVGLYRRVKDGGAVVTVDLFASLVDLATAKQGTDILFEQLGLSMFGLAIWQMAGLTADPQITYDLAVTIAGAAIGTAGVIALGATFADA